MRAVSYTHLGIHAHFSGLRFIHSESLYLLNSSVNRYRQIEFSTHDNRALRLFRFAAGRPRVNILIVTNLETANVTQAKTWMQESAQTDQKRQIQMQ